MAERRMFAKTVVDSDAFLDMPMSARLLYYDLGMRGDDDGFINAPKKIMRFTGATDDDMKLLIAKKFVIPFESGVVVIKHWKIHNYIQNDRYTETKYKKEKSLLALDENKSYTLVGNALDTECIQDVSRMETQVRLGKDRLGKGSIDIGSSEPAPAKKPRPRKPKMEQANVSCQQIADLYNSTCVSLPKITIMSEAREKAIKARLRKYSLNNLHLVFEKAEASDFLKGSNKRNWSADFDWLMKDANIAKVLDGNYDNKKPKQKNDSDPYGSTNIDALLEEQFLKEPQHG